MHLTRALAARLKLPENYHNMPKRFVDRHTQFIEHRAPNLPQFLQKIYRYKTRAYYDRWRPWEDSFKKLNERGVYTKEIFVEPIKRWNIFRGDRVEILNGPDAGKQGLVNYIVKERNWVFVYGLNLERGYQTRPGSQFGMLYTREQPLLVNRDVKLVDPTDLLPTDVEWRYDDDGNEVRVSTRTEQVIRIPMGAYQTVDYTEKSTYKEQAKDTKAKLVNEKTYVPSAKTFEMDICDAMGIKDDRTPYPMYWY